MIETIEKGNYFAHRSYSNNYTKIIYNNIQTFVSPSAGLSRVITNDGAAVGLP